MEPKKKKEAKKVVAKDMNEALALVEKGYVFVEPASPDDDDLLILEKK